MSGLTLIAIYFWVGGGVFLYNFGRLRHPEISIFDLVSICILWPVFIAFIPLLYFAKMLFGPFALFGVYLSKIEEEEEKSDDRVQS